MKNIVIVIVIVLSLGISSNLVAKEKMTRGKIVVFIGDDFVNKKSEVEYFLQEKDATLIPISPKSIGNFPLRAGQRAIMLPNGKLHYPRKKAAGITFNKISGKINVLIVLLQPSDEDTPWEAEKAKEYFQSSKDFFGAPEQHSKIELELDVVGWVKSQKTKSELTSTANSSFITAAVTKEAIKLVDDSVDFNNVDCLLIVVADNDRTWSGAWASLGSYTVSTNDGYVQISDIGMGSYIFYKYRVINHELGHAILSQPHSGGAKDTREGSCSYKEGEVNEYGDVFDPMGSGSGSFFSLKTQYEVGFLPEERVVKTSVSAEVKLCPKEIENADEKQLVIIESGDNEYFTAELYEKGLESYNTFSNLSGLLIRRHGDVVNNDGYGGYNSVLFCNETSYYDSFLHPGEEICGLGTKGNISIKYVSLEGKDEEAIAKVEVTIYGAPEPTPTPSPSPTPEPTPSPTPFPPIPTPTPTIIPTPSPYPTPTVEKINLYTSRLDGGRLVIKKGTSAVVSVETLGSNGISTIPLPNVTVTAMAKRRKVLVSPAAGKTDANGLAEFTITAKSAGNTKIFFTAQSVKKILTVKVK